MNKKQLLWLDDIRSPYTPTFILQYAPDYYYGQEDETHEIIWVKTYKDFVDWIGENGMPDEIGFDHDLGLGSKSGYDAAKWIVDYCIDNAEVAPSYFIQSANPVGAENINCLLQNLIDFQK